MSYPNGLDLSGLLSGPNLSTPYGASYLAQMTQPYAGGYSSFVGGPAFGTPSTLAGAGGAVPGDIAAQYAAATAPAAPTAAPTALNMGSRLLNTGEAVDTAGLTGALGSAASDAAAGSWLGPTMAARLAANMSGGPANIVGKIGGTFAGPFGPALLGYGVTQGLNKILPSTGTAGNVREALADASMGAGLGGTIGTFVGGPGVGTGVGALIGGGLGGAYGIGQDLGLFGDSGGASDKQLRATLENNAKMMGLTPSDYTSKFDLATKAGMTDAKGNKLSNQDIANMLGSQMSREVATTRAQNEASAQALEFHKADLANNLALQSQAQQFMQPYQNNIIAAGVNQAKVLNSLADQMPGQYKGVFQAQAANALNQSQTMAGAYAQQIALQPSMQIMNNYAQQQQAEQAQMNRVLQLAVQMKQQAASGGGASSFGGVLAQNPIVGSGGGVLPNTVPGMGY